MKGTHYIKRNVLFFKKKFYWRAAVSAIFFVLIAEPIMVWAAPTSTPLLTPTSTPALTVGELVKGSDAKIYIMNDDNQLHWIPDEVVFQVNGYAWSAIQQLDDSAFSQYIIGEPLATPTTSAEIETAVKSYFSDMPIMTSVAKCESGFRQFNTDGTVILGSGRYVGIFQIDKNIHGAYANSLGMDINTVDGNIAYAKYLYNRDGMKAWPTCAAQAAPTKFLTHNLSLGDSGAEVRLAQHLLNEAGFKIAKSGAGSLGRETKYFGPLMQAAVKRFQCAKKIVCSGSVVTTGYGAIGSRTRAVLLVEY